MTYLLDEHLTLTPPRLEFVIQVVRIPLATRSFINNKERLVKSLTVVGQVPYISNVQFRLFMHIRVRMICRDKQLVNRVLIHNQKSLLSLLVFFISSVAGTRLYKRLFSSQLKFRCKSKNQVDKKKKKNEI